MPDVTATATVAVTITPTPSGVLVLLSNAANAVTVTPAPAGALELLAHAAVDVEIEPLPRGARFTTYTDADGQRQSIYIAEFYKSRPIEQTGSKLKYSRTFLIHGTSDPTVCVDIGPQVGDADDLLPSMVVARRRMTPHAWAFDALTGATTDGNIVQLEVDYETPDPPQSSGADSEATFSYDFAGESEHVDLAISQYRYGPAAADGDDLLINFDGETVEGIDIEAPVLEFTEEHTFTEAEFSPSVRRTLRDQTQKVNGEAFREYDAGEVLFTGASATKRGKRWYVTFRFRSRRNLASKIITLSTDNIGGTMPVNVVKKGWEYLWIRFEKRTNAAADQVSVNPVAVHVAQVYEEIDFAVLGIGVAPLP